MRNGELKLVFDAIEEVLNHLGIDYYLIGALARQVWYDRAGKSYRMTKDVDYAVLVGSRDDYERVKDYLIIHKSYTEYKGNTFVLISPEGLQVDLLPFGEIEADGQVRIAGFGMTTINTEGLYEVYQSGVEEVAFETGNTFKVATLSAIALLKFIAFDDRPEHRQKDVSDIANLLKNYFYLNAEYIYEHHNDLFEDRKIENIGSIVLGRDMAKILKPNHILYRRLEIILQNHINSLPSSIFKKEMAKSLGSSIEEVTIYLKEIYIGYTDFDYIHRI